MQDNEYKITRTFSVTIKLWKKFRVKLRSHNLSVSEVLTTLIEKWLVE